MQNSRPLKRRGIYLKIGNMGNIHSEIICTRAGMGSFVWDLLDLSRPNLSWIVKDVKVTIVVVLKNPPIAEGIKSPR